MQRGTTGEWIAISTVGSEAVRAFLPAPLPPEPPLKVDRALRSELDRALLALGRLDGVSTLLPDTALFLCMYVRKEAVLSSQIEGTQSSLADLLLFELDEAPGVPLDDVQEVSRYVAALEHGLNRTREGFPLSSRLLRETHGVLLAGGRGADKGRGEFRTSQNWIGGPGPGLATYVPPPPDRVADCMSHLERYLHDDPEPTPVLIKAALAHAQFEAIHPFLDGNGRLGRLLITLLLCSESVLREPLLYLSLYFRRHRADYYDALQRTRTEGDWEHWLGFFAAGVRETADEAVNSAQRIARLFDEDRTRIRELGRAAGSALQLHEFLQRHPVTPIARAASGTGLSFPTVTAAFSALGKQGVVRELTGKRRNRLYGYARFLEILGEGGEHAESE